MKKITNKILPILISGAVFLPEVVQAQNPTIKSVINQLTNLVRALIPILAGVALLVFIAGLAQYLFQGGDKSATETGKNRIVAGVIGLFVIAAIWGLVQIVGATLDLGISP